MQGMTPWLARACKGCEANIALALAREEPPGAGKLGTAVLPPLVPRHLYDLQTTRFTTIYFAESVFAAN